MNNNHKTIFQKTARGILYVFHYISWLFRYLKLKLRFNALKDIKIISVEFSSICNLRCKYCFIEELDRSKFLDIALYEKLIKEICENPRYRINVMEWPISGEFFVYPKYKEVIEITHRYMDKYPHFRPHIILNSNLVLMNEEKMDLILNSGVIRQIICSIDGHNAQTFEDMRPPAKFATLLKNMRLLVEKNKELKNPLFIQINNGRDEHSAGKEYSEEMKEILKMGNSVTQWQPQFWNESFNKSTKHYSPAKGFCSFVFNNVTLSSSGQIAKCCMDLKGSTAYADLAQNTLEEIWHSHARRQFLTFMFKNKRHAMKGCNTCSITFTNNDNRHTNALRASKRKFLVLWKGKDYFLAPLR